MNRISRICLVMMIALAGSAWASKPDTLPPAIVTMAPGIHRLGTAQHRVFGVPVFSATLWIVGPQWTASEPHALDVMASRKIPQKRMVDNLIKEMREQQTGSAAQRTQWQQQLMTLLPPLTNGDQLVVFCSDQNPTQVFYNGAKRGQIDDPNFCAALFHVWLHPSTSFSEARRALLRK